MPNLEPGFVARAADRPDVWMVGSATFLLLLYFYFGSVVHYCHGWEIGALGVLVFYSFTVLRPPFLFLHLLCNELLLAAKRKG
jgi:hypothetical protein